MKSKISSSKVKVDKCVYKPFNEDYIVYYKIVRKHYTVLYVYTNPNFMKKRKPSIVLVKSTTEEHCIVEDLFFEGKLESGTFNDMRNI